MKTSCLMASLLLALVFSSSDAAAQCSYHPSLCDLYRAGYCANVNWPRMYIPAARRSVCSTYNVMTNNGWRRQNLLGDYHFNEDTNELTQAGKLKVNWILSQAPPRRRSIYVQRGSDVEQTGSRIAAVQDFTSNMSPSVGAVDVNDTHIVAEGSSAGAVDNMFVGFQANQPPPVLSSENGSPGNASSQ